MVAYDTEFTGPELAREVLTGESIGLATYRRCGTPLEVQSRGEILGMRNRVGEEKD